ncbi:MBL fold metallo-hydrolase [Candidatus Dojkabacteria bacterium]|nr:MBL fold metallo-hydrolase [Candidatus Dojkabacteria bacterium]
MKIQFCGAARTVTGSCYFLDTGKYKLLVDCGAFQGPYEVEKLNREKFPFDPAEIDYVFLTHSHFDHCGRLPVLIKQGFKGKIIATQPTRDIAQVILLDSARIQEEDYRRYKERAAKRDSGDDDYFVPKPMYHKDDVNRTMEFFKVYAYGESLELGDGLEFRMRDAGHILGSASFELWVKNAEGRARKFLFSGDLGQPGQRIIRDPDMVREADYVVVESTYGNRLHKSKDDTVLELLTILQGAAKSKSKVIIPTFAVERAQEILYELNLFYEKGLLDKNPVFLDSPMAIEATKIFRQYPTFYDEDAKRLIEKGDDPFGFPELQFTPTVDDSKRIVDAPAAIIMAGSGMCTGGRVLHHLKNNIEDSNNHVVFVGYQVKGTLGRRLVDREKTIRIHRKNLTVRAQVHTLGGFSAHADERDLRYWLRGLGHSPRTIFVTHGEEQTALGFAANIREELRVDTYVPNLGEVVEL